jgi:aryl-alcohol dehydrogenase-like predicted oxidoreductase
MSTTRRRFLQSVVAVGVAGGTQLPRGAQGEPAVTQDRFGKLLPQRRMGRTDQWLTILGVGGAHLGRLPEHEAQACVDLAMEKGVRFWDTAVTYQNGRSEIRYGKVLVPKYRDFVFMMTKTLSRNAAEVRKDLDQSRKRMRLDVIDLWQIHGIESPEDVDARIDNGVLDVMLEAKNKGIVRHIGFTGHRSVRAHLRMLERLKALGVELDTCQMPVNVVDPGYESFVLKVLPTLLDRGYAPLAMKTLAYGQLFGKSTSWISGRKVASDKLPNLIPDFLSLADCLRFVWSQPVCSAIVGFDSAQQLGENIECARNATTLNAESRERIAEAVAQHAGPDIEFYKRMSDG